MNPSNVVSVEAQLLEVGHNLGMGREAIFKLIQTTTEKGGRTALGDELRRLKGRHRRLSAGIEKRVDEDWFIRQRERADERQEVARGEARQRLDQQRDHLSLGGRLDEVLKSLTILSTAAAGSIARQSRPSESPAPTPVGELPAETYGRRALLLIRAAEVELERLRFGGADTRETTEERNRRLIAEYEGFTSSEVSFVEPSMGHPVTIERIRREAGRKGRDGKAALKRAA